LRARGHVATGAHSGSAAIALARQLQPHLIIVDIVMGERGGLDVARTFKSDPMLATIPIIALTASPDLVRENAALFQTVLTKPCPAATLFAAIDALGPSNPQLQ
jgi:CheY-like chemotaxis protein